ncbi:hypothetical protein HK405_006804, partial [Cladochytrium tenue]
VRFMELLTEREAKGLKARKEGIPRYRQYFTAYLAAENKQQVDKIVHQIDATGQQLQKIIGQLEKIAAQNDQLLEEDT